MGWVTCVPLAWMHAQRTSTCAHADASRHLCMYARVRVCVYACPLFAVAAFFQLGEGENKRRTQTKNEKHINGKH